METATYHCEEHSWKTGLRCAFKAKLTRADGKRVCKLHKTIPKTFLNRMKDLKNELEYRMDWHEYFMSVALLVSLRSPSFKLKVGSVIVKDNRVISSGYNGYPTGAPHESIYRDNHEINTIHSEQNSISDSAKRGVSIDNGTIYITHFPCINCCKYIISSGIRTVIYLEDYNNDILVNDLFRQANVIVYRIDQLVY